MELEILFKRKMCTKTKILTVITVNPYKTSTFTLQMDGAHTYTIITKTYLIFAVQKSTRCAYNYSVIPTKNDFFLLLVPDLVPVIYPAYQKTL